MERQAVEIHDSTVKVTLEGGGCDPGDARLRPQQRCEPRGDLPRGAPSARLGRLASLVRPLGAKADLASWNAWTR